MSPARDSQVILISGAAGGLGTALCRQFLLEGHRVVAGWHQTPVALQHGNLLPFQLDVRHADSTRASVEFACDRFGTLNVLINNAGVIADELLPRMSDAPWSEVMEVNLKGAFQLSQAAIKPMIRQRDGHIVNISSHSGRHGAAGQSNYAAAKAGMIGLTQSLAKELGPRNVRVNAVLPGLMQTGMTATLSPDVIEAMHQSNALGRINTVDEIARFVVFLTSMSHVSGQVFTLDSRIGRWC